MIGRLTILLLCSSNYALAFGNGANCYRGGVACGIAGLLVIPIVAAMCVGGFWLAFYSEDTNFVDRIFGFFGGCVFFYALTVLLS